MREWTREFKQRFNPHVHVDYDCTSEASEEEWNDDDRDDDAPAASSNKEERERQKRVAISNLIPGHKTLLKTPSREEVQ